MKKNYIIDELKLAWHSKMVCGFSLVIIGVAMLVFSMQYSFFKDAYGVYLHAVEFYQESGLEATPDMERELLLQKNLNSATSGMTDDAINYDYAVLQQALYSSRPEYTMELAGEGAGMFFGMVFGVFGIIFTTIDYKNKTIKHKVARIGKGNYIFAKLSTLVVLDGILVAGYFVCAKVMGIILWNKVSGSCEIAYAQERIIYDNAFLPMILMETFLVAVIYSFLGAFLGTLFKNAFAGTVLMLGIPMLPDFLGKFDLGNAWLLIEKNVYNFYGAVSCGVSSLTSLGSAIFIVAIYGIGAMGLSLLLVKRRSSYM